MGEYATSSDGSKRIKIGTCEDLMYVTRADLVKLGKDGWRSDSGGNIAEYLDMKSCRVALPSIYHAPGDIETIENRKPDYTHRYRINIGEEVAAMLSDIDHGKMYHYANGTNFIIPCPFGKEWDKSLKTSPMNYSIDLVAEGLGTPRAIYQCPYCKTKFNLRGHVAQTPVLFAFEQQYGANKLGGDVYKYLFDLIAAQDPITV
jgi:hypothetical protein